MTLCTFCRVADATTRDHIFPRLLADPPIDNPYLMPLCAACNSRILSKAEELVRNSLSFRYRNTYLAADRKVAPGLRAIAKHPGKGRAILRTNPRGPGMHRPRLIPANGSQFGQAVIEIVKKLVIGLEFVSGRLAARPYTIDRQAHAWDIPIIAFRRSFESFFIWELHEGSYQVLVAQRLSPQVSEYAFLFSGNLLLHGRVRYNA